METSEKKHFSDPFWKRYLSAFVVSESKQWSEPKAKKSPHCTSLYPARHRPKAFRAHSGGTGSFGGNSEWSRLKLFQLTPGQCQPLPHFKHIVRAKSKPIKAHSTQEDLLWPAECTVCGKHLCQRDRCWTRGTLCWRPLLYFISAVYAASLSRSVTGFCSRR